MKESVKVLKECIELQLKKAKDYQNPHSSIKQANYYRRGLHTLLDTMHSKVLRMCSVLEAMENDKKEIVQFALRGWHDAFNFISNINHDIESEPVKKIDE